MTRNQLAAILSQMHHCIRHEWAPFLYAEPNSFGCNREFRFPLPAYHFERMPKKKLWGLIAKCATLMTDDGVVATMDLFNRTKGKESPDSLETIHSWVVSRKGSPK